MIEAELSKANEISNQADGDNDSVEFQRSISDGFNEIGGAQKSTVKNKRLYCFACHRMEYHYNALKGTSYHHLLIGFTFGLAWLFGPFRCRCCGHRRMCRFNFLNPRFHVHKWKYAGKGTSSKRSSETSKSRSRSSTEMSRKPEPDQEIVRIEEEIIRIDEDGNALPSPRRKRRKKKKLRSVPHIDSIGKDRKDREKLEEYLQDSSDAGVDFSIDGLVGSFETQESRKERLAQIAEERSRKDPFIAKKAKPRKKIKGKPKRRYAKKERLNGPKIYCFNCKQKNEHFHVLKGTTYYAFLFGISFGLSALAGPFRCSVCSKKRMCGSDAINPKYVLRNFLSNANNGYGSG